MNSNQTRTAATPGALPSGGDLIARAQAFLKSERGRPPGVASETGAPLFDPTAWPPGSGDPREAVRLLLRHVDANIQFAAKRLAGRSAIPEHLKRGLFLLRLGWVERALLKLQGMLLRLEQIEG